MQITMKETRRGSEDGFTVQRYEAGQSYDVAHTLACQLINNGWAFRHHVNPLGLPTNIATLTAMGVEV